MSEATEMRVKGSLSFKKFAILGQVSVIQNLSNTALPKNFFQASCGKMACTPKAETAVAPCAIRASRQAIIVPPVWIKSSRITTYLSLGSPSLMVTMRLLSGVRTLPQTMTSKSLWKNLPNLAIGALVTAVNQFSRASSYLLAAPSSGKATAMLL